MSPIRCFGRGCVLAALSILVAAATAWGAGAQDPAPAVGAGDDAPITVEAESIQYSVDGKRFVARTGVRVEFEDVVLRAGLVEADLDRSEFTASGGVVIERAGTTLSCAAAFYNWDSKVLNLVDASTVIDGVIVKGDRIDAGTDRLTVTGGSFTRCDLPVPEYRISTARLTIYPGKRLIAEDAWLWVAERRLVPVPRLVLPLRAKPGPVGAPSTPEVDWGQELPLVPRLGYSEEDGVSAGFTYRFYTGERSRAWADVDLATKQGLSVEANYAYAFEPDLEALLQAGVATGEPATFKVWCSRADEAFSLGGGVRRFASEDGRPVLALPEMRLDVNPWRIGPLTLGAFIGIGNFREEDAAFQAWRGDVGLRLFASDLTPGESSTVGVLIERRRTWYSTGEGQDVLTGSVDLSAQATPRLTVEAGYSYTWVDGDSPFEFDDVDTANCVSGRVTWRFSQGWSAQSGLSWSLETNELAGLDFAAIRHLHCFDVKAGWDQLDRRLSLTVRMTR